MAQAKKPSTKKTTAPKTTNPVSTKISKLQKDFKKRWDNNPTIYTGGTIILLVVVFVAALFIFNRSIFIAGQINGKFVTTPEFYSNLVVNSGEDTWDQLVRETLIKQEAAKKGVTATQSDINTKIKDLEKRFGGKETFESTLAQNNTSIDDLKDQIVIQILVEKLLEDKIKVSAKEIAEYKKENKSSLNGQTNKQIEEALKAQKLNEEFLTWFEGVKKNANLKTYF